MFPSVTTALTCTQHSTKHNTRWWQWFTQRRGQSVKIWNNAYETCVQRQIYTLDTETSAVQDRKDITACTHGRLNNFTNQQFLNNYCKSSHSLRNDRISSVQPFHGFQCNNWISKWYWWGEGLLHQLWTVSRYILLRRKDSFVAGRSHPIFHYNNNKKAQLMLAYPRDAKTMKKIPPFRSYNKFQSSRKSGVYSN